MPLYTKQQIETADHTDLAAFLLSRGETVTRKGRQSLWKKHQVWIDGAKWYLHYDAAGGYAIAFVMRYYSLNFSDAVGELLGETSTISATEPTWNEKESLVLSARNPTMNQVYAYLMEKRFISREVISFFAHERMLYEDTL